MFMEHPSVDPFNKSLTIVSACNRIYRTLFLQPDQIGIIPPQSYGTDNQSTVALCWMDWFTQREGLSVCHAFNSREQHVEGVKVDGMTEDGTVLKFHGGFFHGHVVFYAQCTTVNPVSGLTMQELREKRLKTDTLRRKGHVVIEKWECEFRKDVEADEELKAFFDEYELYFPFGGRTNAIVPHRQVANIRYVNFTSLHPWVCKYGLFPLGHPSVLYKDAIPDRVQGLLKCKILPPSRLYHPLLPAKINGKLMFVLCRACGEEGAQGDCTHTDKERALTGTWVSEIDKALALGYRMITKYAAWHFEETTRCKDGVGGPWAEYIDLWLKLK